LKKLQENDYKLLDILYEDYSSDLELNLKDLQLVSGISRKTIGNYYTQKFGEDYKKLSNARRKLSHQLSSESRQKISIKLKGKKKPPRTKSHREKLSLAFKGKTYLERFGNKADEVKQKIINSNKGKKRNFQNKELWRQNLKNALKGRKAWNKGKKGVQKAWNKLDLPVEEIINLYNNPNHSSQTIASKYNVSQSVILRILNENKIKLKTAKEFLSGKTLEERYGKDKALEIIKKSKEKLKGRKYNWGNKISDSLKEHYKINPVNEKRRKMQSEISKKLWADKNYKEKQIKSHKKYIENNPSELERLKNISPSKITKIEAKMLDFLKQHYIENKDFYFDQQDKTFKTLFRPDFQFPDKKWIIELYGYYKHFTKEGKQKDKIREYYLRKAGWRIIKFNHLEIERNYLFHKTKEKVLKILKDG